MFTITNSTLINHNNKNKMKKVLLAALIAVTSVGYSQTTEAESELKTQSTDTISGWKKGGFFNLTFGQVALSNWSGGGTNSMSGTAIVNLFADYTKGKLAWENDLNLGYGVIQQGKASSPWIKNDDKINFSSKVGQKISKQLFVAALLNLKSQFTNGYETELRTTLISKFAAPAYSIAAIGIDYVPNKYFSAFVAPVTLKTTIVGVKSLADAGMYGVEAATYDLTGGVLTDGKMMRNEFGGYLRLKFAKDFTESITVESKADLFSNYLNNPQNIDVNWEVLVAMKIGKYLTTTITTNLIYDDDIDIAIDDNDDGVTDRVGPRIQFKEVFGLGLSYKF
jgi:hypothetical protein